MKKIFLLLMLVSCFLMSFQCEEDIAANYEVVDLNALITYNGDPAFDGCSWLLLSDNETYSPVSLPEALQQDSLEVMVKVELLDTKYQCSLFPGNVYPEIKILEFELVANK